MAHYLEPYLEFTGLTMSNMHLDVRDLRLPGGEITDTILYHMFSTGLFDRVTVYRGFGDLVRTYDHSGQMRFVAERDRLEIRRLQAEIRELKGQK